MALDARAATTSSLASRLASAEEHGRLHVARATLAVSYLHMWSNRMLRGSVNLHEVVLYDFLARTYESELARAGRAMNRPPRETNEPVAFLDG
jgi:hypothetical protein